MIKQNRTSLQFLLGGILMLTMAVTACNNGKEESKDAPKDSVVNTTPTPAPTVKDSMEPTKGNVAPGNENKPAATP
jgi:hypothetical protein